MVRRTSELVSEVLDLPVEQRIELVERLLHSLEEAEAPASPDAASVAVAWDEEVARRDADGDDAYVDGDEALKSLRSSFAREPR